MDGTKNMVAKALKPWGSTLIVAVMLALPAFGAEGVTKKWSGELAIEPLTLESPLSSLPIALEKAQRIPLPFPPANLSAEAATQDRGMGGTVRLFARLKDGWLVGTDAGEWMGNLSIEKSSERKILAKGNVRGGFRWHGRLYVLTGLRHLGIDQGELWEVDLEREMLVRRISLPAAPEDIVITKDGLPIIRTKNGDVALVKGGATVDASTL